MKSLHPIVYGIPCEEALAAQAKLAAWLDELSPHARSQLRKEFLRPDSVKSRTWTQRASQQIEVITGFSIQQPCDQRPDWGLAIRA